MKEHWQVVIFMVDGKANHVGLSVPEWGLADLSLLGARLVPWSNERMPKGERLYYKVILSKPEEALAFLKMPGLLCAPILARERACRGWHLTRDAPDYVRVLRDRRSRDPQDMNCVEWIVHSLELGGLTIPDDVLTPTELRDWCELDGLPNGKGIGYDAKVLNGSTHTVDGGT